MRSDPPTPDDMLSSLAKDSEEVTPAVFVGKLGPSPNLAQVIRGLNRQSLSDELRFATWRELLITFPTHPDWERVDESGGPSIETVIDTSFELRWDLKEEELDRILPAIRMRPGFEEFQAGHLRIRGDRPLTYGYGGLWGHIKDSRLTEWHPQKLDFTCGLDLDNCTGTLRLGTSLPTPVEDDVNGLPVLDLDPDLDVVDSLCLIGRKVRRALKGGGFVDHFVSVTCDGWKANDFQGGSIDTEMPVEICNLSSGSALMDIPLGKVHIIRWGTMDSLPDGWTVPGALELVYVNGIVTLPKDLRFDIQPMSPRCNGAWSRFPDACLLIDDCPDFCCLPEGLEVPIGLHLVRLPLLRELPASLRCKGVLSICECPVMELPKGVCQLEELHLEKMPIATLPEDLSVNELYLEDLPNLVSLPDSLGTMERCYLRNLSIQTLPRGLKVSANLVVRGCTELASLPSDLLLEGDLELSGCPNLVGLPSAIRIGGRAWIEDCQGLRDLPRTPHIDGTIYLKNLPGVAFLPEGFTTMCGLNIEKLENLISLPNNLSVGGELHVEFSPIHALPNGMSLKGDVTLCALKNLFHWSDDFQVIHGDLRLHYLPSLEALPDGLIVEGKLEIRGCDAMRRLPRGLRARSIECSKALHQTLENKSIPWAEEASEQQIVQERIESDPFLEMFHSSGISDRLQSLTLMALHPEFIIRGRWLVDGRLQIYMEDQSGNGHEEVVIGDYESGAWGYQARERDFLLRPEDLELIRWSTVCQIQQWGFGWRGALFSFETEPSKLEEAYAPYHTGSSLMTDGAGDPRPFHVHLHFYRKLFLGGGMVAPLGQGRLLPEVPSTMIIAKREVFDHFSISNSGDSVQIVPQVTSADHHGGDAT